MKQQKYLLTAFDKVSFNSFGKRQRDGQEQAGGIIKKGWLATGAFLCASLLIILFCWTSGRRVQADTSIGNVLAGGSPQSVAVSLVTNKTYFANLTSGNVMVDGSLDSSFVPPSGSGIYINAIAVQQDGKVLIGGLTSPFIGGQFKFGIARLNPDGTGDVSFNAGGTCISSAGNDKVNAIKILTDGKILIAGYFTTYNGVARKSIARLNSDGTLDTSFVIGSGLTLNTSGDLGWGDSLAVQPDGKILIGGKFNYYNGMSHRGVVRLNPNGTVDSTFNIGNLNSYFDTQALTIQPDGKILLGGRIDTNRARLVRLNSNGSLDSSFNPGTGPSKTAQDGYFCYVHDIALYSDGKILIVGGFDSFNGISRKNIAKLNSNGSLDTSFDPGTGASGGRPEISTATTQADGKILIGGNFTSFNGMSRNNIARLTSDGSLDNTFNPGTGVGGNGSFPYVYTSVIQADGKLLIGGGFSTYNGITRYLIARLLNNCCTTININPSTVAVNQTTNLVVNGSNFQNNFTASVTTPNGTFPIAAAGLTFVNSSQVRVQVNMGGTPPYTATLRITNPDNQSVSGQFQVVSTTNSPPVINSISPSQIPTNQQRILTVNGSNFLPDFRVRVQGVEIAPAELTFINSSEVRVQVSIGGTPPYQASLILTNPDGQTASGSFNVNNTPPNPNSPTASFTFAPTNPNVNQAIQFTSTSTGQLLSHAWDFQGDGVFDSISANPTFTFTTPGPRNVILRVTNSYGSSAATNVINVGTTNTSAPFVTNVFRTYPGLYFLKNTNATNFFDIRVNWNGSPGRVRLQINNNSPVEINGTTSGLCHPFNLNTAFSPSWSPSIIKITPINGQGVVGDTSLQTIYVFPYETWLDEAIADLGESIIQRNVINGQTGCSTNLLSPVTTGEIKTGIRYSFPPVAINWRFPGNVPNGIPLFGGYPLGLNNVKGNFLIEASNNGTGRLQLQGGGQFTAMGGQLDKLFVLGSGEVGKDYRGLIVREANFQLGITGKLRQERGVLTAFPQLSGLTSLPVVGGIFRQFNERATVYGEIQPNLAANFLWKHDPTDRRLKFIDGTGELGLDVKLGIYVSPINQLRVESWVGGGGKLNLAARQPYLRRAELNLQGGIRVIAGWFSYPIILDYRCTWQHPNSQMNCDSNSTTGSLNDPFSSNLELINYNYSKFGDYEVLHPNAEDTNKIEVKANSEQLASISESSLISNLFPEAEPTILQVGNGRILLWVRQNPNLTALQSTEIAWSYHDGMSWSNPAVIINDTRNEFAPVAGVDPNGKIVAAWLRIKDPAFSLNIENFEQLPLYYKQVEVVSAVFNPATRTWSTETVLTDDLALDTSLRLSADNAGKLLLTWQSNPSGEFVANSANPATLKYSFWNGTSWNAIGTITNNLVDIGEHAAAVKGNNAFVIVPRDPDANTLNDRLLEIYSWNGSAWSQGTIFAGGATDNFLPSTLYDSNGQGHIVWLQGADLVQATLTNPAPLTVRQTSESMGFYNARLLANPQGNLTLVWQEVSDNGPANIYAMLYDTTSQTWSADLRLNDSDWLSKNATSYYGSDGKLRMAYLATQILRRTVTTTINGESVEIPNVPENGQTDLRLLEHSLINDLATTDADLALSPQFPRAGESVTATLKLRNSGDFSLNNFNVKLYNGNPSSGGILLSNTRVAEQLAAGETRTVTLSFINPQIQQNIIAVIDADNEINEFSEANNQATVYFENTPPVAIATANVTSGNAPLTVNLNASSSYDNDGDALSFAWSFADGSQSATGAIVSHTFEQTGLYPVTVSVTDSRGAISTATVNVSVNCNTITISPSTLQNGATNGAYSQNLDATGGVAPYSFVVTSGALPAGLTLAASGLLSGIPIEAGTFNFTVTATYANGCPGTRDYTLVIDQGIVSGRITYANALITTSVPFTTLTAAGSLPLSSTTDSNGDYSLSGFALGAYTITPSKTNQVNGISNLDASRVAQHIVGLTVLNANQLIAADTSGNGAVSSLDAAYIAQFVASIPNPSITGSWKFLPASRSYLDILTNQTNQDYSAILVGDVTGNWNPAGPLRPELSVVESKQTRQAEKAAKEEVVTVTAQRNESVAEETAMTLNLTATETTGEGILGYQFELLYDATVIKPQAISCDVAETISRGMTAICHVSEPGVLKVVVFGTTPMSGKGTLLTLNFKVVGMAGKRSPLTFQNFMFNEGLPSRVTVKGQW